MTNTDSCLPVNLPVKPEGPQGTGQDRAELLRVIKANLAHVLAGSGADPGSLNESLERASTEVLAQIYETQGWNSLAFGLALKAQRLTHG